MFNWVLNTSLKFDLFYLFLVNIWEYNCLFQSLEKGFFLIFSTIKANSWFLVWEQISNWVGKQGYYYNYRRGIRSVQTNERPVQMSKDKSKTNERRVQMSEDECETSEEEFKPMRDECYSIIHESKVFYCFYFQKNRWI